ncbi:hypothetical protein QC334_06450 [Streptomyces sp. DH18]|uniref:hypothetical protein n=1 Tax=Streptomyces sp. DH18 TaxID=3040126 RepID=UPI002441175E|nr:hypothetical protein [Streptomyces sp. DH18]MDG9682382.1 hypothetical protein [Streptomyces sp. DH18]
MPHTNGEVTPTYRPATEPGTLLIPAPAPARITLAHTLLPTACVAGGTVLRLAGDMPTGEILELLAGCGATGAVVVVLITGGRHLGAAIGRAGRALFAKTG